MSPICEVTNVLFIVTKDIIEIKILSPSEILIFNRQTNCSISDHMMKISERNPKVIKTGFLSPILVMFFDEFQVVETAKNKR